MTALAQKERPHVLIIGGGFGGLTAAQSLGGEPVDVTLVDRANHHLFQPLLYQVAMAGLSPAEIALPIRSLLRRHRNVRVFLGEVVAIDLERHRIDLADGSVLTYDFLILAAGARTTYFGHDSWATYALGLKSVDDAVEIRRRVLLEFEYAERSEDEAERSHHLTFPIIGAGPTGVELAGALAELAHKVLAKDFRRINAAAARVILLEGGPRVLPTFDETLSASAERQLRDLGVEVRTHTMVRDIDARGVHLDDGIIEAGVVIWAAGVGASPLASALGVPLDSGGPHPGQPRLQHRRPLRRLRHRRHRALRTGRQAAPWRQPDRDAAGARGGQEHPPHDARRGAPAVPLLRQGLDGDYRPLTRHRRESGACASPVWLRGSRGCWSISGT